MNVENNIRFLVDKLNLLGPDYILKIDKNIKWKDFENKNVEECIKDELYLDEKSQHDKYFNKRTRQFSNVAKLLVRYCTQCHNIPIPSITLHKMYGSQSVNVHSTIVGAFVTCPYNRSIP